MPKAWFGPCLSFPGCSLAGGELLREVANLEEALGRDLDGALRPEARPDEALSLQAAAAFMGEPVETFRRRHEYRKALLSRDGERRLRYSRVELERIKRDRLEASALSRFPGTDLASFERRL